MNLLVTNHAQVLACIARAPASRLRDVAATVGLTERAVQSLVTELEQAGFLKRIREGRRNRYEVAKEPLRALARDLDALVPKSPASQPPAPTSSPNIPTAPLAEPLNANDLSFID